MKAARLRTGLVVGVMVLAMGSPAGPLVLIDEDFQTPLLPNGTLSPPFAGWTWGGNGTFGYPRSRIAPSDGTPGSTVIPNQVVQSEWNIQTANYDITHNWGAGEVYALSLNASPQQWSGASDRSFMASLSEQGGGPELWSGSAPLPKYDGFGGQPWTPELTFSFQILSDAFTAGTPGQPLSLKLESTGARGMYFDNVLLTTDPTTPPGTVMTVR